MGTRAAVVGSVALIVAASCAESSGDLGPVGGTTGTGGASTAGAGGSSPSTGGTSGQPGAGSSGSGGAAAKPRLVQSGSRLEAVVYRGADGSQHPTGKWFDTLRGEECTFRPAADGVVRCLPEAAVPFSDLYVGGCSRMAVDASANCLGSAFSYVTVDAAPPAACAPAAPKVHLKGERLDQFGPFFRRADNACQPVSAPNGLEAFAVGAEVPPAEFVAATVERLAP